MRKEEKMVEVRPSLEKLLKEGCLQFNPKNMKQIVFIYFLRIWWTKKSTYSYWEFPIQSYHYKQTYIGPFLAEKKYELGCLHLLHMELSTSLFRSPTQGYKSYKTNNC